MSKYFPAVVAALVCLGWTASVFAADAAPEYVGNAQCKMCHNKAEEGGIWQTWSQTKHAKAFATLASPEAKAIAEKKGLKKPAQESPECLKCHVTAYDAAKGAAPAKIVPADGVQCETCHGPASLHVQDGKAYKMKKDTSINMAAHIKKADEATCKKCHNEESPTFKSFDYKEFYKKIEHHIVKK